MPSSSLSFVNFAKTSATFAAACALAGCASSGTYRGGRTWEDGWRPGTVRSLNDELRWYQRAACDKAAAPGDKFVSVNYRLVGSSGWKFIPMPAQDAPAPGTKVLVNVNTCELVRND